jgi:hypothetical protein
MNWYTCICVPSLIMLFVMLCARVLSGRHSKQEEKSDG